MADLEELIDLVLEGQHTKLKERCNVNRIVAILEAFGAYDAAAVRVLLAGRYADVVLYKKNETKLKELDGRVACKLTADNHGRGEWWLLLERVES